MITPGLAAAERIDAKHAAYMRRATTVPTVGTTALITMGTESGR